MPWVKIDDGFFDNRTNRALGAPGRDLFLAGLCYCAKGLTDGIIAKTDLALILAQAQAKPRVVEQLVKAGRWIDHGDHYEVDEYLTYQWSRARVEAEREASRERQRRARARGSSTSKRGAAGTFERHGVTDAGTHGGSHPLPDPTRPPTYLHPVGSPGTPTGDQPQEGHRPDVDLDPPPTPRMTDEARATELAGIAAAKQALHPKPATG